MATALGTTSELPTELMSEYPLATAVVTTSEVQSKLLSEYPLATALNVVRDAIGAAVGVSVGAVVGVSYGDCVGMPSETHLEVQSEYRQPVPLAWMYRCQFVSASRSS